MSVGLMTSAEMDAYERRWKWLLFVFAAALVVDLAYLYAVDHAPLARLSCWLLALASGIGCAFAMNRLNSIGYLEAAAPQRWEPDAGDVVDVVDALTDIASND